MRDVGCASAAAFAAPYLSFGAQPDNKPKEDEAYIKDPIRMGQYQRLWNRLIF